MHNSSLHVALLCAPQTMNGDPFTPGNKVFTIIQETRVRKGLKPELPPLDDYVSTSGGETRRLSALLGRASLYRCCWVCTSTRLPSPASCVLVSAPQLDKCVAARTGLRAGCPRLSAARVLPASSPVSSPFARPLYLASRRPSPCPFSQALSAAAA
jgi:hypothetical protein